MKEKQPNTMSGVVGILFLLLPILVVALSFCPPEEGRPSKQDLKRWDIQNTACGYLREILSGNTPSEGVEVCEPNTLERLFGEDPNGKGFYLQATTVSPSSNNRADYVVVVNLWSLRYDYSWYQREATFSVLVSRDRSYSLGWKVKWVSEQR